MDGKTKYKINRFRIMRHKNRPLMYRFLDFVDEFIRLIFSDNACRAFLVTHNDLADNLAAVLYCEVFTREFEEFERNYVNIDNTFNINMDEFRAYKYRMTKV
jgi:hypothetical protein